MDIVAAHATNIALDVIYMMRQGSTLAKQALQAAGAAAAGTTVAKSLGPRKTALVAAFSVLVTVAAVLLALFLEETHDEIPADCPAPAGMRAREPIVDGPIHLLALAEEAKSGDDWTEAAKETLQKCVRWEAAAGATVAVDELRAQLECHSMYLGTIDDTQTIVQESVTLNERTRTVLAAVQATSQKCEAFVNRLQGLRRNAPEKPGDAIVALSGLAGFEAPASDAAAALGTVTTVLEKQIQAGDWDAEDAMYEVPPLRIKFRSCLLKAAKDARSVAQSLPRNNAMTMRAQQCRPDMLVPLEQLAFAQAEGDADPGVVFNAGLLKSEIAVAPTATPFFGKVMPITSLTIADARGLVVPRDLALAEQMLLQGVQASMGPDETEKAALSAIRLCQHAKFLMDMGFDAASEWRYRAGAELAAKHGRDKLASHTFGQLSYFLSQRGKDDLALEAATEAMGLGSDPLASYLQVMLRMSLGELRTADQVKDAARQLITIDGKLPSRALEETRTATYNNLALWNKVSMTESSENCLELGDVANVLICLLGKVAYMA
eukprot:TRINITY_DN122341_c0_g1_i1.p1 TRINITY_DN122341_c0_g1~~TRINITY_DN122341_c0_g1_i1.p1  ORF type:complete len:588 (+),score=158.40 TRINITY_DN122341_c0_g1_i1:120-1766(+)